jgi:hypothetical protein
MAGRFEHLIQFSKSETCVRAIPRRDAPELCMNLVPPLDRGCEERRMPVAPAASCALVSVESTRVTTSTPESPGVPARNGFTTYFELSPVTGLFCHRRLTDVRCIPTRLGGCTSARLDASVGASGPHDFAVRNNIVRPLAW